MKIAFDIDGVVLQSINIILDHVKTVTGVRIPPSSLLSWDLEPLGIDPMILMDAVDYMYSMAAIEPYEGAVETLKNVYEITGSPLLFITGRSDLESARHQLESLPWNGKRPEMIVTGGSRDKRNYLRETGAEFIIEDDELHLGDYLSEGVGVGLMIQPWNRTCKTPVTARFDDWIEIDQWLMRIGDFNREPRS
ncbi:MAG: hypothetical protein M0T73_00755 [Deltaproteobacteria bacterium]|nr:hypothetical protein [Deltaproteobacteria bacterium]